jgi:hypothetical protein
MTAVDGPIFAAWWRVPDVTGETRIIGYFKNGKHTGRRNNRTGNQFTASSLNPICLAHVLRYEGQQ